MANKSEEINWATVKRKISDLAPFNNNPRRLTKKQFKDLKKSLKKFNLAEIPVVNLDNTLIAGHQRLKILEQLKGSDFEVDVRVPNRQLTPKEAEEYNIRSNKNTGEWDFDILANSFDFDSLLEYGFTKEELGLPDIAGTSNDEQDERENTGRHSERIDFLPEDHELFVDAMENIEIEYDSKVRATTLGLKLGKLLRQLK